MRTTFAERQATKREKAEQLKARAKLTENRMSYEIGREVRKRRLAALYRVLEQDPAIQEELVRALGGLVENGRARRILAAIMSDEGKLAACEKALTGKAPRGWEKVETSVGDEPAPEIREAAE